jgi:siroheme synthase (precorrin-2 oxidase/ferrochelatase)
MKLPTTLNVKGPVVIFGGGTVGLRKVEYMRKFTDDIIVVSDDFVDMPTGVRMIKTELVNEPVGKHIPDDTSILTTPITAQSSFLRFRSQVI